MKKAQILVVIVASLLGTFILVATLRAEALEREKAEQLTGEELKEAEKWAAQVKQAKKEFEQAQAALNGSAVYQQYEAARAKYNLAMMSQENAFNVACGEHGIKPSECEATPDGKGVRKKEQAASGPKK